MCAFEGHDNVVQHNDKLQMQCNYTKTRWMGTCANTEGRKWQNLVTQFTTPMPVMGRELVGLCALEATTYPSNNTGDSIE